MTHYVYRIYGAGNILLYVGEAKDPNHRLHLHRVNHAIFIYESERIVITEYPTIEEGRAAEKKAIYQERPKYNRRGAVTADTKEIKALRKAYATVIQTGSFISASEIVNASGFRTRHGNEWSERCLRRAMDGDQFRGLITTETWNQYTERRATRRPGVYDRSHLKRRV